MIPRPARLLLGGMLIALAFAANLAEATQRTDRSLDVLEADFLEWWLTRHPEAATRLGRHDRDDRLAPMTESWVVEGAGWLRAFRVRLEAVPRSSLTFERALERDLLEARVDRELFDLEGTRRFERDPGFTVDLVAGSLQPLLVRDFASPCERVRDAAGRLQRVPEILRAARVTLKSPPRLTTEAALPRLEAVLRIYRSAVPELGETCRDARLQAELAEADTTAVRAVESFLSYLREDLLPRARPDFAIGAERLARMLAAAEMESTPLDSLRDRALRELDEHRRRLDALAERIAPGRGAAAALASLASDPIEADSLLPFVAAELGRISHFLRSHELMTLAPDREVIVREAPSAVRDLASEPLSLSAPGPWETRATKGFCEVVLPESAAVAERPAPDRWSLAIACLHEARPGRFEPAVAARALPSRLRQAFPSVAMLDGWADYCEEMALAEGFGGDDPRYELAQLARSIGRLGRCVAGISLHAGNWTPAQAAELLETSALMTPEEARREVLGLVVDPTPVWSTLGAWRLRELREEVRGRLGPRFRLRDFHDAVLRQGGAPFPLLRAGVIHDLVTSPALPPKRAARTRSMRSARSDAQASRRS